jgi:hypothetical protein
MYAHLVSIAHASARTDSERARCLELLVRMRELDARRNTLPERIRELRRAAGLQPPTNASSSDGKDPVREMDNISHLRDQLVTLHHRPYNCRTLIDHIIFMIKLEPSFPLVDGTTSEADGRAVTEYHNYLEEAKQYLSSTVRSWPN